MFMQNTLCRNADSKEVNILYMTRILVTSQFVYLELRITQNVFYILLEFEISRLTCIHFTLNIALRERLRTHKVFRKDHCFYFNYHKFSIKSYVLDVF